MLKKLWMVFLLFILLVSVPVSGCAGDKTAEDGDTVKVHYTGTLADGSTFDSSVGREPLEFTLGTGRLIPGFENAVRGMKVGESKTVDIPAAEAYGEHNSELVFTLRREQIPGDIDPVVGDQLQLTQSDGRVMAVVVTATDDLMVTVDANHRLAGKDLTFEIEVVEITR